MNSIEIKKIYSNFGLTDKEFSVYLKLLESGPTTTTLLSKATTIPRTTVRENLDKLINRGLVGQTIIEDEKKVFAEPPEKFRLLLLQKKTNVENSLKLLNDINKNLPSFLTLLTSSLSTQIDRNNVSLRFYENKESFKQLLPEMLKADEYYSFINLDKYYELFPNTEEVWHNAFIVNKKRKVYDILIESTLAKEISSTHERFFSKTIPDSMHFGDFEIFTFDNKVGMIQLDKNNFLTVVVESELLSHGFKSLHQTFWKLL